MRRAGVVSALLFCLTLALTLGSRASAYPAAPPNVWAHSPHLASVAPNVTAPPPQAAAAGYRMRTWGTTHFSASNVDSSCSYGAGFQWYCWNWESHQALSSWMTLPGDGTITTTQGIFNATLASAYSINTGQCWKGIAFGGGLYVEALVSFNPAQSNLGAGWPAVWSSPVEHTTSASPGPGSGPCSFPTNDSWFGYTPTDPYYENYIEPDFMEAWWSGAPTNTYLGTMIHWYAHYNSQCPGTECSVATSWNGGDVCTTPSGVNYAIPHKFGYLWVPATALTSGYAKYFFDGKQVCPTVSWTKFINSGASPTLPPPTTSSSWLYGIIDYQHLVILFGTGQNVGGTPAPMKVYYVNVWQKNGNGNLRQ